MELMNKLSSIDQRIYNFTLENEELWSFIYTRFNYLTEEKISYDILKSRLLIKLGFSHNTFLSRNSKRFLREDFSLNFDGTMNSSCEDKGYSPVICSFRKLDDSVKEKIFRVLSSEPRNILERGLKMYEGDCL